MKRLGSLLIFLAVINTIGLWILSKPNAGQIFAQPFRSIGQITGLLGAILISIQFILASRFGFLEKFFGSLDRVYRVHVLTGSLAFLVMLNHPLFLAMNVLPSAKASLIYFLPSKNLAYTLGVLALYLFAMLLIFTLFIRLPYHIWKFSHAMNVVPLGIILFHMMYIPSDISSFLPLRYWIIGSAIIALATYGYRRLLYPYFGPRYEYEISRISQLGNVVELELAPLAKSVEYLPGQFVFLSVRDKLFSSEEHPFSLSSSPGEKNLRVSIKASGDYTSKMGRLREGTRVSIMGPYGGFAERSLSRAGDDIWIAGGIGVTPFLSLLKYYLRHGTKKHIWFFYSGKGEAEVKYISDLNEMVKDFPNIQVISRSSKEQGRLNARIVADTVAGIGSKQILLCGPVLMMEDLTNQFLTIGVHPRNIFFENFNFV
ncbi:hypothetical protein D4R52_02800 [bacterium]|nr:MAG: hypothetical protein D4R52_02800 [bacterium]